WPKEGDPALASSLAGRRLGVVGLGRIGRRVAQLAEAFGMEIRYGGPRRKDDVAWPYYDDLVRLAREVDVLMVTCKGGPETAGLIGRAVIEALGPEGWLINVARGSVVDQPVLVEALVSGRLGAAGLDVFAKEPHVPEALLGMDNVVLQPHQGSASEETRAAMGRLVLDNLEAHFAGRPLLTPVAWAGREDAHDRRARPRARASRAVPQGAPPRAGGADDARAHRRRAVQPDLSSEVRLGRRDPEKAAL